MIRRSTLPIRRGFTLVELLVAMGLSVLIMYIMAECSKICLDAVSISRSNGLLSTQLQGAGAVLSRDLMAEHFLRDDTRPGGGVKLSQYRFDQNPVATPPKAGFFRIISPQSFAEQVDVNNFTLGSATNHALHFTSILPASDQNPYSATVPAIGGTIYRSRAAEVALFLVDANAKTSPGALGRPLYNLVRRQRLVAMTDDDKASLLNARTDTDVIASNGTNTIYSLTDMRDPTFGAKRLSLNPAPGALPAPVNSPLMLSGARFGEDLLATNVLSFEVLVDWTPNTTVANTGSAFAPRNQVEQNWEYPFDNLYWPGRNIGRNNTLLNQGVFDTWSPFPAPPIGPAGTRAWNNFSTAHGQALPLAIRVKQIQVTIRIFDPKTKLARQNTWKFSM